MLRKSILIGLFVLKNNRTIAKAKSLQGGQESQLPPHAFFWAVTGVNGLIFETNFFPVHVHVVIPVKINAS